MFCMIVKKKKNWAVLESPLVQCFIHKQMHHMLVSYEHTAKINCLTFTFCFRISYFASSVCFEIGHRKQYSAICLLSIQDSILTPHCFILRRFFFKESVHFPVSWIFVTVLHQVLTIKSSLTAIWRWCRRWGIFFLQRDLLITSNCSKGWSYQSLD